MRVVVAPDKFKGSATAKQVAAAISTGLRRVRPDLEIVEMPVADGGDGTVAALLAVGFRPLRVLAEGPTGAPVMSTVAMRAGTAVVELADVAGLGRLPEQRGARPFAPLTASTYGVGLVIAAALDAGAATVVLGLGGSASTDGGAGMVQALGVGLTDERGDDIARGGAALCDLAVIDPDGVDARIAGAALLVASDVDNPLLGPLGAAAEFGPQKGASPGDVALLGRALARWAVLTEAATGRDLARVPGAGAAGGAGFAAMAYLGARLVPGADLMLELIGFDAALTGAALVVTGEGSLDRQSLGGKAPVGVARAAARRAVPVVVVAGRVLLTGDELAAAGFAAGYSLADLEPDPAISMATAAELLERVGSAIAAGPLVGPVT